MSFHWNILVLFFKMPYHLKIKHLGFISWFSQQKDVILLNKKKRKLANKTMNVHMERVLLKRWDRQYTFLVNEVFLVLFHTILFYSILFYSIQKPAS